MTRQEKQAKNERDFAKAIEIGFSIEKVASQTWIVKNELGESEGHFSTERKAINAMTRFGSYYL